jgi:nitrite reductase/ring-hydroxylating ferredoxin subunit
MLVKVCSLDVFSAGNMKQFQVKEQEILIIKRENQFFGLAARCTHAGAPLEEGTLNGDTLTCPWHGSQFRITDGVVLRGPAEKALKTYAVSVEDDSVFIQL